MKKNIISIFTAVLAAVAFTSCVGDLDTLPLNETETTSETAYADEASYLQGLSYVNAYWAFVSQNDPGEPDLDFDDAGKSELARMYMLLNELSADSFKCIWGDDFVNAIQYHSWTDADNSALVAAYSRCMKGITLANEYLLQTEDDKLSGRGHDAFKTKIAGYRAEARFHRAMYYWVMMDLFGNPPFALPENIGGELPKQIKRADLYAWLETELLDLLSADSAMPKKGEVAYPRPTQGSVGALLARMYLNAEVYTGTAQWEKARDMAQKVIKMGYTLHDNYAELFMQDNTTNGAIEEFIFAIDYDNNHAQSWGGTTTLVSGTLSEDANKAIAVLLGLKNADGSDAEKINVENWNGYHVADDYVARFNLQGVTWEKNHGGFGYDRANSDKRAFFYQGGATADIPDPKTFDNTTTATGWYCWKFNGRYSDGTTKAVESNKFSSADYPIFRLAEMYLIYAEADARLNGGTVTSSEAIGYVKALRDRAGVSTPSSDDLTLDWLLDERARELMWEGCRRTDLIRYGYFTSASFPWTLKGGVANGKVALPSYRSIYPLILDDLNVNSNLEQNPGY